MIRSTFTLATIAALSGLTFTAQAAAAPRVETASIAVAAESVEGKIASVDLENKTFEIEVGDRSQTFKTDETTKYYLGDKISTREEVLKVGKKVTVTYSEGLASRVDGEAESA